MLSHGYQWADLFDDDTGEPHYEFDDMAASIARESGIGITSDRELSYLILDENNKPVGAAWTAFDGENYEFDVAVTAKAKGLGFGTLLLDRVDEMPEEHAYDDNEPTMIQRVVNPVMHQALLRRGYMVTERLGQDDHFMSPVKSLLPTLFEKHAKETAMVELIISEGATASNISSENYSDLLRKTFELAPLEINDRTALALQKSLGAFTISKIERDVLTAHLTNFNTSLRNKQPKMADALSFGSLLDTASRFSQTIDNHGAGFHFEEGGCWGFAGGLHDHLHALKIPSQLVYSNRPVHCYVKVNDSLFDHQGANAFLEQQITAIDKEHFPALAEIYGVDSDTLMVDIDWAANIIADAGDNVLMPTALHPENAIAHRQTRSR
jgi:hypothetical protein